MIQEISDYLLIRSLLYNSDSEELIEVAKEKDNYIYILNNIYELMQEEDFIFVDPHLVTNVEDFIYKYRFDYNRDKEINDKMNYIIGRLNDYKNMSDKRKQFIIDNWVQEESQNRNLPFGYKNLNNLLSLISLDTLYYQGMISIDKPFNIEYVVEYVSIINIIMNRFSESFNDDIEFLEVTRQNLQILKDNKKISKIDSKMIKEALKKVNKQYSMSEIENFQKVIKKTEK